MSSLIPRIRRIFSSWSVRVPVIVIVALIIGAVAAPYLFRPPSLQDVGFSYSPNPMSLFHLPGSTTVTLTSHYGFSGTLDVIAFYGRFTPTVSPSSVYLASGGSVTVKVSLDFVYYEAPIDFDFSISNNGAAGSQTRGFGINIITNSSLALQSYTFPSSTNATLTMHNAQVYAITPTSYDVSDSSADQYTFNYSSPSPNCCSPGSTTNLQILIGSGCPACTLKGGPFSFTSGRTYTLILETSPSYQFVYKITR